MSSSLRFLVDACAEEGVPRLRAADQFEQPEEPVRKTGYALLDAQLPGGGWPVGALIEVLCLAEHASEWQLVVPALAKQLVEDSRSVLIVEPPYEPCGRFLQHRGVPAQRLCKVVVDDVLARLWVCEQALQCREVSVVLAWLPGIAYPALRRLHVAAAKQKMLFWAFRPKSDLALASPAALRVLVEQKCIGGLHSIELSILKRRGPPSDKALQLSAADTRLTEVLEEFGRPRRPSFDSHAVPSVSIGATVSILCPPNRRVAA